jgi:hypothetical protein
VQKRKKIIFMEQKTNLIEEVGNLLELKMNSLLKEKGISLVKNPDKTSQQYFFSKDSKLECFRDEKSLFEIKEVFEQNFSSYGLGCVLDTYCIYFGIAHLSTEGLKECIVSLKKN